MKKYNQIIVLLGCLLCFISAIFCQQAFCKINNKHIDFIADSTKEKIGKFTPGTHIPVVSINHFRKTKTDYTILCSWNHRHEIFKKEKFYTKKGGKWISHVKI